MKKKTAKIITRIISVCGFLTALLAFATGIFLTINSTLFFSLFPLFQTMIGRMPFSWFAGSALLVLGIIFILLGLLRFWIAYSLWEFKEWARIVEIIIAAIGMLQFPLGTVINAIKIYFLGFDKDIRRLFG